MPKNPTRVTPELQHTLTRMVTCAPQRLCVSHRCTHNIQAPLRHARSLCSCRWSHGCWSHAAWLRPPAPAFACCTYCITQDTQFTHCITQETQSHTASLKTPSHKPTEVSPRKSMHSARATTLRRHDSSTRKFSTHIEVHNTRIDNTASCLQ